MANVNVAASELVPLGGATNAKEVLGWIDSAAYETASDTWTVTNAKVVKAIWLTIDASGSAQPYTVGGTSLITLTSATTGAHSALVLYTKA